MKCTSEAVGTFLKSNVRVHKMKYRQNKLQITNKRACFSQVRNYKFQIDRRGQSLIEVLVAFAVSVLVGVALITAGLATQKSSRSAKNETQATKLAQEYLEQARTYRDVNGFAVINALTNGNCYTINSTGSDPTLWTTSACSGAAPCNVASPSALRGEVVTFNNVANVKFCRKILVADTNPADTTHKRKITVEIGWQESGDTKTVTADTVLSQWCSANITSVAGANGCP